MQEEVLARRFERDRAHLTRVALHVVGTRGEAEDVVQDVWLKASRADHADVGNLTGWLTTVTARTALDRLRARHRRRERPLEAVEYDEGASTDGADVEVLVGDDVARAVLLVVQRLGSAERVAFVLHDVFSVPFDDVAEVLGRSIAASKQLASRARRKVVADPAGAPAQQPEHLGLVATFLAASRDGDLATLLHVLAPDVVRTVDPLLVSAGTATTVRGADAVARETRQFADRARAGTIVLIDGAPGIALMTNGRLTGVITISVGPAGSIEQVDIRTVGDATLSRLSVATVPRRPDRPLGSTAF